MSVPGITNRQSPSPVWALGPGAARGAGASLSQLQAGGSEHQRSATYLRSRECSEGEICPVAAPSLEQRCVAVLSGPSPERHGTGWWWRPGAPRSVQVPCFVRVLGGGAQPAAPQDGSPVLRKQGRRGQCLQGVCSSCVWDELVPCSPGLAVSVLCPCPGRTAGPPRGCFETIPCNCGGSGRCGY